MKRIVLLGVLCLVLIGPVRAEDQEEEDGADLVEPTLQERIDAAIDKGVAWLKSAQRDDGSWGTCHGSSTTYDGRPTSPFAFATGPTSFALFTLLRCGVGRRDPVVKKGLKWLRGMEKTDHEHTSYESASIVLMLTSMYDTGEPQRRARKRTSKPRGSPFSGKDWKWMHERIAYLLASDGCRRSSGGWGYRPKERHHDLSATQFALLALRAAARAGYPVENGHPDVWIDALDFTRKMQVDSGAMFYGAGEKWTAGITAAGLANYLICRERIRVSGGTEPDWLDERVETTFGFLGRHYRPTMNVQGGGGAAPYYHYCYLYAVERVGALGSRHLLDDEPWYPAGASYLVAQQKEQGRWLDPTCMGPQDTLATCFALLFLKRATPPAVITPSGD